MRARMITGILVVILRVGYCVGNWDSLNIYVSSAVSENCQKCLLECAGAIHVEEIEETRRDTQRKTTYWIVGPSGYLRVNLMRCFGAAICRIPTFEESGSKMTIEKTGGITSPVAFSERPIFKYVRNEQRDWATSSDLSVVQFTDRPASVSSKYMKGSTSLSTKMCLYRSDSKLSFLCETCIKTYSDSGYLVKYFIRHSSTSWSVFYMIHSSDYRFL